MNEGLKKLAVEINGNESLQKKMLQCASAEEAFELARTISDGYTQEEFISFMQKVSSYKAGELSEDDLAHVAGGFDISGFDFSVSHPLHYEEPFWTDLPVSQWLLRLKDSQ